MIFWHKTLDFVLGCYWKDKARREVPVLPLRMTVSIVAKVRYQSSKAMMSSLLMAEMVLVLPLRMTVSIVAKVRYQSSKGMMRWKKREKKEKV